MYICIYYILYTVSVCVIVLHCIVPRLTVKYKYAKDQNSIGLHSALQASMEEVESCYQKFLEFV